MLLNPNFLSIKELQIMNLQLILTRMINSCALIKCDTKYLKKLIYNLVKLVLNTLQNLPNFYFRVLTVIHILRVYLVQSEIPALMVATICYIRSQSHATNVMDALVNSREQILQETSCFVFWYHKYIWKEEVSMLWMEAKKISNTQKPLGWEKPKTSSC